MLLPPRRSRLTSAWEAAMVVDLFKAQVAKVRSLQIEVWNGGNARRSDADGKAARLALINRCKNEEQVLDAMLRADDYELPERQPRS